MASEDMKLLIHTSGAPASPPPKAAKPRRSRVKTRLSFQERLLRNSFLACAVLLGILALNNVPQPWAIKASEGIEKALTMKINLDQSIGRLSFVERLLPESTRVFLNLSEASELTPPVQGTLTHAFAGAQPYLMFAAESGAQVCAAGAGTVSAISPLSDGSFGVLIDHGNGLESVTACLATLSVSAGDALPRGGAIGTAGGEIYFELRESGEAVDPTARMGL